MAISPNIVQRFLRALDPSALMEAMGLVPDAWQQAVLRAQANRSLLLCSRQAGKSTVAAVAAMWEAVYKPPALVLLLSPSLRQSQELFRKVLDVHRVLDGQAPLEAESALRLELQNGSRIISLPESEDTIRGFSNVRLLIVDEAARVSDDFYMSVRPMLAVSGGRLVCLSTPAGRRGWFYREWTEGGSVWQRTSITAAECPRISREFLEEERTHLGELWWSQEYFNAFIQQENQVFEQDLIENARRGTIPPLFGRAS